MLERYGFYLLVLGFLLGCIGWIWLIVAAFKVRMPWGLAVFFSPPSALFFVYRHYASARRPLRLLWVRHKRLKG